MSQPLLASRSNLDSDFRCGVPSLAGYSGHIRCGGDAGQLKAETPEPAGSLLVAGQPAGLAAAGLAVVAAGLPRDIG